MPYPKIDSKRTQCIRNNQFSKLSLKKNKIKLDEEPKKNRSSDIIILDDSFDRLQTEFQQFQQSVQTKPKLYSPVVINDSSELSDIGLPSIKIIEEEPSRFGNVSFNDSKAFESPHNKELRPSIGGWSPAQHIICATPRTNPVPTTPKDTANESYEKCSMNKIQQSQKKLLSDLYGDTWKSIPALFKTISKKYDNFDGVSKKLHFEDEKENIRHVLKRNKELYLTSSDVKRNEINFGDSEKKAKKKLFTEKVPNTPDIKDKVKRNVNSTTKKTRIKGMSVTELVRSMSGESESNKKFTSDTTNLPGGITTGREVTDDTNYVGKVTDTNSGNDITENTKKVRKVTDVTKSGTKLTGDTKHRKKNINDIYFVRKCDNTDKNTVDGLTRKIEKVHVSSKEITVTRLSFMGSLADNVPSWRCHIEALQYKDSYKTLKEQLSRRLFKEFNKAIFDNALDADMPVLWDGKLRSTAGTTTNRLTKNSKGDRIRTSSIKLSTKVVDAPQRLRDTLVHELCHAATWLIDAELRAGHGPLWKKWAAKALRIYPELGEISRCHDLEIHFKYSYKCSQCGYSIQRHSKSIDVTKKCCGYCRGTFEIVINKKNKDGVVVSTPARKGSANGFAQFVKEHYAFHKEGKTHAQVMKVLSEEFATRKNNRIIGSDDSS